MLLTIDGSHKVHAEDRHLFCSQMFSTPEMIQFLRWNLCIFQLLKKNEAHVSGVDMLYNFSTIMIIMFESMLFVTWGDIIREKNANVFS